MNFRRVLNTQRRFQWNVPMATRRYAGWCDDCQKRQESWEPAAVDRKSKGSNYDMGQKETSFAYFKTRNELLDNQKASQNNQTYRKDPRKQRFKKSASLLLIESQRFAVWDGRERKEFYPEIRINLKVWSKMEVLATQIGFTDEHIEVLNDRRTKSFFFVSFTTETIVRVRDGRIVDQDFELSEEVSTVYYGIQWHFACCTFSGLVFEQRLAYEFSFIEMLFNRAHTKHIIHCGVDPKSLFKFFVEINLSFAKAKAWNFRAIFLLFFYFSLALKSFIV